MRILLVTLAVLSLLLVAAPVQAKPECVQVYPWSELCDGDVEGFQEAVVDDDVCYQEPSHAQRCIDATSLVTGGLRSGLPGPEVHCIESYPASALCAGDVGAFVCWYVHCDEILAP